MNSKMAEICGYLVCAFVGLLAAKILVLIWTDTINLKELLSEANGDASMARLQLMIFTFVIAISLFMMVEQTGTFPLISDGVLTLLGISGTTYAVGKGISYSRPEGVNTDAQLAQLRGTPPPDPTI
jgi:hypothetical protein